MLLRSNTHVRSERVAFPQSGSSFRSPLAMSFEPEKTKMAVNSSAVLPPAAGIICLVDDDFSMLKALDRLLSSAGLQAQLFSEPLAFLSSVTCNSLAPAVSRIRMSRMNGLHVHKQ